MLATVCGYDFPTIDAMTMQDFKDLTEYWLDHPPAHILIAGYMGYKPRSNSPRYSSPETLASLLGCDPNNGGTMKLLH